jgi:hypothetical protein
MKLQPQADGTFLASAIEDAWYVLVVKKTETDAPCCIVCSRFLGSVTDDEGLRRTAHYHATSGRWCSVEIWQSAPGTWSEPSVLLETYQRDGTCAIQSAPLPPGTTNG